MPCRRRCPRLLHTQKLPALLPVRKTASLHTESARLVGTRFTHKIRPPSGKKIHTQNLPASWEKDSHAQAVHCLAVKTEAWHKKQTNCPQISYAKTAHARTAHQTVKTQPCPPQNIKFTEIFSPKVFVCFSSKVSVRPVVHFQRRATAWLFDGWGGKNLTMH